MAEQTGEGPGEETGWTSTGQFRRSWPVPDPRGTVVVVHGLHEHGGRYAGVAAALNRAGYAVHAVDHPGHGRSPGRRGDLGPLAAAVAGVEALVAHAVAAHPGAPVVVYGHSLGGLVAATHLSGAPHPAVVAGVLSAPALSLDDVPPLQRRLVRLLARVAPGAGVRELDVDAVSRDPEVVRAYRADPLTVLGRVRARTAAETVRAVEALPARLATTTLPLLLLHGDADRLVPPAASEVVRRSAASRDVTLLRYPGLFHEPHHEPERDRVLADVVAWLDARVPGPPRTA
ncbi:alpha/beta hydrolase [Kineococcus terrestris]|uniref:alpha/beta hydrolase n=1 Tax=Kineococcus terrestris TaxID=2044856 RepID=UPI0034DB13D2